VSATVIEEEREPSVLADFDAGYLLDTLSFGIIVLDEQLCTIYANATAQKLLDLRLPGMRGRPFAPFLPRPERFACAARRTLKSGAAADYTLRVDFERSRGDAELVNIRVAPLSNQMSGTYILLEMSIGRQFRERAVSPATEPDPP
jgi:PAS domain-containing protein